MYARNSLCVVEERAHFMIILMRNVARTTKPIILRTNKLLLSGSGGV